MFAVTLVMGWSDATEWTFSFGIFLPITAIGSAVILGIRYMARRRPRE